MIRRITGVVFLAIAFAFAAMSTAVPESDRPAAYVVAGIFGAIGLWRLFARKGH